MSRRDRGPLASSTPRSCARRCGSRVRKLDPRVQVRNPVMFVVEIGALITTVAWLIQLFGGSSLGGGDEPSWFTFSVTVWLWLTVVFANLAEALAEGRGRAQAASLRAMRTEATARRCATAASAPPPSWSAATSSWSRRGRASPATAP